MDWDFYQLLLRLNIPLIKLIACMFSLMISAYLSLNGSSSWISPYTFGFFTYLWLFQYATFTVTSLLSLFVDCFGVLPHFTLCLLKPHPSSSSYSSAASTITYTYFIMFLLLLHSCWLLTSLVLFYVFSHFP